VVYKYECLYSSNAVQISAWNVTETTADAVSEQASALSSLAASAPDELSATARTAAASFCRDLLQHASATDTRSISSLLSTIGALSNQANSEASSAGSATRRRLRVSQENGNRYDRFLSESVLQAEELLSETNEAILDASRAVLEGSGVDETPVTISVSCSTRTALCCHSKLNPVCFVQHCTSAEHVCEHYSWA
jgi:hypothetical protein